MDSNKKLHLIRHAKSSWADSSLADIDRPLNQRGLRSCRIMAPAIANTGCRFNHVFSSTAIRAQATIEQISRYMADQNIQWQVDSALYTFDNHDLLAWCRAIDDSVSEVVIIGHNPAITDLCNTISNCAIKNIPTCGYVQLAYNQHAWRDLSDNTTELLHFLTPKMQDN